MKKRMLSLLLACCMVFVLLPTGAHGAESDWPYDFSGFDLEPDWPYDFSDFDEEDFKNLGKELLEEAGYDLSMWTSEFYDWEGIVKDLLLDMDEELSSQVEADADAEYKAHQMELKEAAKKDVYTQAEADARWWKLNEEELILDGIMGDNETFLDMPEEKRSTVTRLLLDYPDAESRLTGVWWMYYEDCYHNIKEVWLSPQVDAKKFLDSLREDEAGGGGIAYSSGIMNGMVTIFVPDSQLPRGLLSYSSTPTNPYYSVKVYSGDVYDAYDQGPSAGRDWCPGHEYTAKIQTASRMYQNITCQRPNLWYYSCKWCGQCEYNPNHTFSLEIGGSNPKDTSNERANHVWYAYDLSEKNYIGTNARGEKIYSPSCIWCGLSFRESEINYTYQQFLGDMTFRDSAENRQTYQNYINTIKSQWAPGGAAYNMAMEASVDSYRLPYAFAVAGKDVTAKVSTWAQDGVNWAAQNDLIDKSLLGSDYTGSITRLQFCSVAVKMAEKLLGKAITPAPSGTFTDTDSEYVRKAVTAGITSGVGEGRFDPNGTLSRQQMATFLYRALQYVKNNSDIRYTIYDSKLGDYSDRGQIADWATEPMAFMNALGLVNGTSDTTLAPNNNCTIEQALIVANRSLRADLIGWYQSLASTDKNVTDSSRGGNATKRCFYAIPSDVQADGRYNQLRYRHSERFWVTGAAQTESWLTRGDQAQGDYIRFLKMIDPYTGDTLYIENCNFRPVKAD